MAIIVTISLLLYGGFLLWFLRRVYLARYYLRNSPDVAPASRYRLAHGVGVVLTVLHAFALFAVAAWLPFFLIMTVSQFGNADWGVDVSAYSGFRIDVDQLPSVTAEGLRQQVISGRTMLDIDSSQRFAWFLYGASNFVASIIVLYVLLQLRNIFVLLSRGNAFSGDNVDRLRRVGYVVVAVYLVAPLMQYFGWGSVIDDISFSTEGIRLFRAFELNPVGILVGIGAVVLAGVIEEAAELEEDQRLTV